jgi:hypothetical protein
VIAIDGTGRLTFPERHYPHCLTATHHGKTTYYPPVLAAKLVCPPGWAFTIMTEFVGNPGENPTKQDCELKAFTVGVLECREGKPVGDEQRQTTCFNAIAKRSLGAMFPTVSISLLHHAQASILTFVQVWIILKVSL